MKIAFFTESYKPYHSGVTISIETFANDLVKMGHEVRIYSPAYPDFFEETSNPSTLRFFSIAIGYPGFRFAIPNLIKLAIDIKKFAPDVIHAHHPFYLGGLAKYWARKLKIPLFYTFHTLFTEYLHNVPSFCRRFVGQKIIKSVYDFCMVCACVIVPTEQAKADLSQTYGVDAKVAVIPTGINLGDFPKDPIRQRASCRKIIHVGRVSEEKNIDFLFEVLGLLPEDIILLIVGGGPDEERLKKVAKNMGQEHRVSFAGFHPHSELMSFFRQADIFVTASKSETQGLVFMEAKAAALPTVAIGAAGAANMVIDGVDGFLVEDDVSVFADSIKRLYCDENLYRTYSRGSYENVENYSSELMAARLQDVYQNC